METVIEISSRQKYRTLFWLLLSGLTLLHLVSAGMLGLGVDESHYVLYSRHLSWGYFDHPPMVAFLAGLTTLLGKGVFFIRLGPIVCSVFTLIILRHLALELYGEEKVAFWALVLISLMPYQHLLMVALLPDATLNLFWCGTLLAAWKAMKNGKWRTWILTGLLLGGALLSKYQALLLPFFLLCYLLTSRHNRFWLRRIQTYIAGVIGVAMFLPNIIWNAHHRWISYTYQLFNGTGKRLRPLNLLTFIGAQLVVWSPLIFGLLIAASIVLVRKRKVSDSERYSFWMSIPVFAFFFIFSLFGKFLPHWPAVGWWTGSLVVTATILGKVSPGNKESARWRCWSFAAAVTGFIITCLLVTSLFSPLVAPLYSNSRNISLKLSKKFPSIKPLGPFKTKYDPSNDLYGWKEIAIRVEKLRAMMPHPDKTFVFCHKFYMTSQLAVYLPSTTVATSLQHRFNQYRLWFPAADYAGWDAVFVVDREKNHQLSLQYASLFQKMDPEPLEIKVFRKRWPAHDLKIYRYYGFKGKFMEPPEIPEK
ncbi:MAG: glycosyltransferase family 39 protein [Candidatus Aminicenantales bacterium]